jgi:hypothetical protein
MKNVLLCLIFPFVINAQTAFISGNDTICDNAQDGAKVSVSFIGISPFTFVHAINGVNQASITTTVNPHIISTFSPGTFTLTSFSDAASFGLVSGSGLVTVLASPTAIIHLQSDTLSIVYPVANFVSQSIGNIVSWSWNFGDNTTNASSEDASHLYPYSSAIYSVSLIVVDAQGCADTTTRIVWVDEFWMYIPNSFTPDLDGINDNFCIEYNRIREHTFLFKVFNSQGDLMFQSANPSELKCSTGGGWNGKSLKHNIDLPLDVYVYEMYFQDFEGWKHQEYGTINLVR